jgi:hypothetical protein
VARPVIMDVVGRSVASHPWTAAAVPNGQLLLVAPR